MFRIVVFYLLLFVFISNIYSQNKYSSFFSANNFREFQLLFYTSPHNSFFQLPLDSSFISDSNHIPTINKFGFSSIIFDNHFNSSMPYGWNNTSMIKAKGFQNRITAGFYFRSKYLHLTLRPEFVYAANKRYRTSLYYGSSPIRPFREFFMGQSHIDFKFNNFIISASTENIWWGPGQYNALMFSNNAPGFPHLSFHSKKPLKTKVGSFELQFLVGRLKDDKVLPAESFELQTGPISDRWRYLNAILLSWKPKWIQGFSLGFSRGIQFSGSGMDSLNLPILDKYLPVISGFFKSRINTQIDAPGENDGRDQQASFMLRYVMPKSNFEVYLEYGYADFKANLRDLAIDAQHGGAYILGFTKLLPVNKERYYVFNAEITHTSKTSHFLTRNWTTWYTHGIFPQGFSHKNQILGAGSGLGNNMQTFHVERVSNSSRLGVKIQKIQNNPSSVHTNFNNIWLSSRRWTDFTIGPTFQFTFNRWSLKGEIQGVYAINYAWLPDNLFNLHFNSSLTYNW